MLISCSCPFLFKELSPAIPIVAGWLFLVVMVTLLKTAFMDPGIIPRASIEESNYIEKINGIQLVIVLIEFCSPLSLYKTLMFG